MAYKNQILDMSPLGMIFTVVNTARDTEGRSLDLHWELLPECNMKDPLYHIHPHAIETYEVLGGEMEFFVKDKWVVARKGDKLNVPAGITHTFRNPGNKKVTVFNTHEPAFKMEDYFEDVVKVLDKVTDNRKNGFNMNLRTMLYMGVLMNRYRNEIIARRPPDAAIKVLGGIASAIGYRI